MTTVIKYLLTSLFLYLTILSWHGYKFNRSDQVGILMLAEHAENESHFSKDFYTTAMSQSKWHERIGIVSLVRILQHDKVLIFVVHAIFAFIFLIGLLKIGESITNDFKLSVIGILILLIPLHGINTGGNELYYNFLISSQVAKSIAVWAVWLYVFRGKILLPFVLLCFACFFQAIVAIQLALIFLALYILTHLIKKVKPSYQSVIELIIGILFLALIITPFLVANNGDISSTLYFEIQKFRNAHHLLPSHFGIINLGIMLILVSFGIIRLIKQKSYLLISFYVIVLIAVCLYTINLSFLKSSLILTSQWFKATIWLEMISVFVLIGTVPVQIMKKLPLNLVLVGSLMIAIAWRQFYPGWKQGRPIDLLDSKVNSKEMELAQMYKDSLSQMVLLLPPDYVSFKYITKCNTFVDLKSVPHIKEAQKEWYGRLKSIYGPLDDKHALDIQDYERACLDIESLQSKGIDGIIRFDKGNPELRIFSD